MLKFSFKVWKYCCWKCSSSAFKNLSNVWCLTFPPRSCNIKKGGVSFCLPRPRRCSRVPRFTLSASQPAVSVLWPCGNLGGPGHSQKQTCLVASLPPSQHFRPSWPGSQPPSLNSRPCSHSAPRTWESPASELSPSVCSACPPRPGTPAAPLSSVLPQPTNSLKQRLDVTTLHLQLLRRAAACGSVLFSEQSGPEPGAPHSPTTHVGEASSLVFRLHVFSLSDRACF